MPNLRTTVLKSLVMAAAFTLAHAAAPGAAQAAGSLSGGDPAKAPYTGPIVDAHLHAFKANYFGPPPQGTCVGIGADMQYDGADDVPTAMGKRFADPPCEPRFMSPDTDDRLRDATLEMLERFDITGIVSGAPEDVLAWKAKAPERVIPALFFSAAQPALTSAELGALFDRGEIRILGELMDQYNGLAPNDPAYDPFLKVAAERDIPVMFHMGVGPPGSPLFPPGKFRARGHSPWDLEDVLVKYPRLRVSIMHAAWPMLDELKAMLYAYPQLYVDTGSLQMAIPRAEYYAFLEGLVQAGFGDRIMYGTDQIIWPALIAEGIRAINDAPFLTHAQKKAIFHDNAVRFFRLTPKTD